MASRTVCSLSRAPWAARSFSPREFYGSPLVTRLGGRFVLEEEIGSGGMSVVYLGRDEILDRPVAMKVLRLAYADSDVGERFRREGRTAARISHPNVVQVYDAQEGVMDGREVSYIVMEHVPGGDLKDKIYKDGPLSEKELCRIGADVASGLAGAHDRGIIHRDVKPQNILIDDYGRPKITDFGIARALDTTQATRTGSYLGTATYSSPEQLRGEPVTPKSDVYSLGATLYEAATGEPPFVGGPIEVASQQISKEPEPLRARGAAVSPAFEALVMAALSKEPANRPDAATLSSKLLQEGSTTVAVDNPAATDALRKVVGGAGAAGTAGLARAAQAARKLGEAGAAATGEAGRRLRERSTAKKSAGGGSPQPVITMQNYQPGRRRALLAAGVLALLLVVGGILLAAGGGREPSADVPSKTADTAKKDAGANAGANAGTAAGVAAGSEKEKPAANIGSGKLTDVEAVNVVAETYLAVIQKDYKGSYAYLSKDFKKSEYPTRSDWEKRMGSLKALKFVEGSGGPTPKLSERDATVTGTVQAIHTGPNRLEQSDGTWTLVPVGGEWRISKINFANKQVREL